MSIPNNRFEIKGYKCFAEFCGFSSVSTTNILIGRNNIGKSSLLDTIGFLVSGECPNTAEILLNFTLDKHQVEVYFRTDTSGGDIRGKHWETGKALVGKTLCFILNGKWRLQYVPNGDPSIDDVMNTIEGNNLVKSLKNPYQDYLIRKISAERDIVPEKFNPPLNVESNGNGATNLIQNVLNSVVLDSRIIQRDFLDAFNAIMKPDMEIINIVTQFYSDQTWEVFLEESSDRKIALSKSGSGLKTVILVLLNLIVLPNLQSTQHSTIIYLFEEIENNLHPALQRRLFSFIHNFATKNNATVFLTTHSSVVIDLFAMYDNARLNTMHRNNGHLECNEITAYKQKANVLDEIGVKASDVLQTNALIWVEGPSDRIYLNKFISIFSHDCVIERLHFQYIYYGGRLLSHYSAEIIEDLINIVRINKNSIIVIDSDKSNEQSGINATKTRIVNEFKELELLCWVTKGREIENYIPQLTLNKRYEKTLPSLEQYMTSQNTLKKQSATTERDLNLTKLNMPKKLLVFSNLKTLKQRMMLRRKRKKLFALLVNGMQCSI